MKRWIAGTLCVLLLLPLFAVAGAVGAVGEGEKDGGYLLNFNGTESWTATDAEVELTNSQWGRALSISPIPGESSCSPEVIGTFPASDISDMTYITFRIYLPDPKLLDGTRQLVVNLMSEGERDGRLTWMLNPAGQPYADGWNTVALHFSDAVNTQFDFQAVSGFRLYFYDVTADREVLEEPILLTGVHLASVGVQKVLLDNCDSADGWNMPAVLDTADRQEGKASVSWTIAPEEKDYLVSQKVYATPVNGMGAVNLILDLYISDVQAVDRSRYGLEIEISSSGHCDQKEYEFDWHVYGKYLHNGWNHLVLPIATARVSGDGGPDMKAINYIRLHMLGLTEASGGALTVKIDNIYLAVLRGDGSKTWIWGDHERTPEEPDVPQDPEDPKDPENPDQPGDPSDPENPENPGGPDQPGTDPGNQGTDTEGTNRRTGQRARILVLIFVMVIVGADIVVLSLRRRSV